MDTGYPQLDAENAIAIIIIIAILYGPRPAQTIKKSSLTQTTITEACYTARARMKQQVLNGIKKLTLQTNKNGQYMHNAILLLQKSIRHILQSQFNPSNPGKGMEKLLDTGDNQLTLVKSTNAIMARSMIKKAKQNAKVLLILTGKTVLPIITTQVEAQEEANQLNVINQLVIGAKEVAVKAITKLVSSNITNAILCTANGSDHKSVNNFTLFDVMQVAIDGSNHLLTNDVLE
jgi:hypothetical protein